jgi:peptide/nickel transport system permease protein
MLAVIVAGVMYVRNKPHLIIPWKSVVQRKRGMISVMILLCYIFIGLMDSVHFRPALPVDDKGERHYATEVISLFDVATDSLRTQYEKTYSAPFATKLFVKEMEAGDEGSLNYDYPPLVYAGQHLKPGEDKISDIEQTVFQASLAALLITLLVLLLHSIWLARQQQNTLWSQFKNILNGKTSKYPLKTFYLTLFSILLVTLNLALLSHGYHVFGTDKVGQDVLYQSLKSVRTGLVIGTLTTLVMLPVALLMGIAAGYFRGWIDDVIQYIYTTLNSIPGVLLIAAAVLMLQVYMNNHPEQFNTIAERADMRLLFLCLILGMTSWTGLCRILRGETLKLRESEYVLAARSLGVGSVRILHRHIMPNLMHIVLITVVLDFSGLVLAEAVLSYVGVGVDPSMISWGNMINSARLEMARDPVVWWSLSAAFISMFILVLAANLFADVVRDAFDPRSQGAK